MPTLSGELMFTVLAALVPVDISAIASFITTVHERESSSVLNAKVQLPNRFASSKQKSTCVSALVSEIEQSLI